MSKSSNILKVFYLIIDKTVRVNVIYYGHDVPCCKELGVFQLFITTLEYNPRTLYFHKERAVVVGNVAHLWVLHVSVPSFLSVISL